MEYYNDNRTPRDRLNEDFIEKLLADDLPEFGCGCNQRENVGCPTCESTRTKNQGGDCEGYHPPHLNGNPLAMVYSPYQEWENLYEVESALQRGTIFKCLDFPFYKVRCCDVTRGKNCRR